jgi:hypothetical protein
MRNLKFEIRNLPGFTAFPSPFHYAGTKMGTGRCEMGKEKAESRKQKETGEMGDEQLLQAKCILPVTFRQTSDKFFAAALSHLCFDS